MPPEHRGSDTLRPLCILNQNLVSISLDLAGGPRIFDFVIRICKPVIEVAGR